MSCVSLINFNQLIGIIWDQFSLTSCIMKDGPRGSGKTVSLLQIIHQCLLNKLIVIHIPSG